MRSGVGELPAGVQVVDREARGTPARMVGDQVEMEMGIGSTAFIGAFGGHANMTRC